MNECAPTRLERVLKSAWLIVDERGHFYGWDTCSVDEWGNICGRNCFFSERQKSAKEFNSLNAARKARCRIFRRCYRPTSITYFDGISLEVVVPVGCPKLRRRTSIKGLFNPR